MKSEKEFDIEPHLRIFSQIAKNSREYQGHGWGLAYLDETDEWQHYKDIKPIWEDFLTQFPKTRLLLVHARSAFQDKDIIVRNNMPFYDDKYVFIFNGELRGVRINEEGRIGAEKIFNYIKRFDRGNMDEAFTKAITLIKKKTDYVRAFNIIMATKEKIWLNTYFNEDEDYFTMSMKQDDDTLIICSDPYPDEDGWEEISNDTKRMW